MTWLATRRGACLCSPASGRLSTWTPSSGDPGVPVVERVLVDGVRGTIGDVAGRRTIILNRHHRFSTPQERRWVLAEELGHVLLGQRLVESTQPAKPTMGLLEERRVIYEREARAFAAELLMPFFEVRLVNPNVSCWGYVGCTTVP
jgi:hypothetical protein